MSRHTSGPDLSRNRQDWQAVASSGLAAELSPRPWFTFTLFALLLATVLGTSQTGVCETGSATPVSGQAHSGWQSSPFVQYSTEIGMAGVFLVCMIGAGILVRSRRGTEKQEKPYEFPMKFSPLVRTTSNFWRMHEDERKQLSRELHDSVGQLLTAIGLELKTLRSASLPPAELRERLHETVRLNAEALRQVRDLAMGLRPALLDDVNLVTALEWQARQFSRQSGIDASVESTGNLEELAEAHRLCIFRCVQEALSNCAKHSRASWIRIAIRESDGLVSVAIEDDGIGFDRGRALGRGLGLLGMRERVAEVKGQLSVASREQGGAAVIIEIPVSGGVLV